ncbi:MAG: tocopherol cyclase family protein [Acholeplasmataceae bacterium]|jgi:hypothetical protein|nr:tocopherol cyclase family protein [Acholeplasmataceae bacterium]
MYIKKLVHPEYFQGSKKKKDYFEGWYYKLVSQYEDYTIALIPGISLSTKDPHAFIQVFISHSDEGDVKLKSFYFRFEMNDFEYGQNKFFVRIGRNYFSLDKIDIQLKNDMLDLFGIIHISQTTPITRSLLKPNIMGPFGYLGFMECYHGVISMTHQLSGKLRLNHQIVSFEDSKGYIEKDWGKSFPSSYVWLQSNHFKDSNTSFMFSYATIPFMGLSFKGLIANLLIKDKEYRFATYNFSKVIYEDIKQGYVFYRIKKRGLLLEIIAVSKTEISLAAPRNGEMIDQIKEGLSGNIRLRLYRKDKLLYEDEGFHAGIEIMMNQKS